MRTESRRAQRLTRNIGNLFQEGFVVDEVLNKFAHVSEASQIPTFSTLVSFDVGFMVLNDFTKQSDTLVCENSERSRVCQPIFV